MAKETLVNWREHLEVMDIPLYILPARLSGWYEEGAWVASPPCDIAELARKVRGKFPFVLQWAVYAPPSSLPLSEGEMESILCALERMIDEFLYSLSFYEKIAKNYRFMFSLCLVAYIIGLFSVNTWWFIWFRQPYLALTGIDNWARRRRFLRLAQCRLQTITQGQDPKRHEALSEVLDFFLTLSPGDPAYLEKIMGFLKTKEKTDSVFGEIRKAYENLKRREKDKSYLLKRIPHTSWTKVKRFFLGDLLLIPEVFTPFLCIPVRDLSFTLEAVEERYAQNRALQALQ